METFLRAVRPSALQITNKWRRIEQLTPVAFLFTQQGKSKSFHFSLQIENDHKLPNHTFLDLVNQTTIIATSKVDLTLCHYFNLV